MFCAKRLPGASIHSTSISKGTNVRLITETPNHEIHIACIGDFVWENHNTVGGLFQEELGGARSAFPAGAALGFHVAF